MSVAIQHNNFTPFEKTVRESGGLLFAEGGALAVSLGAVGYLDKIFPETVAYITDAIAKNIIEPHLDFFEKAVSLCQLKDCQPDKEQSTQDRAKKIARGLVIFPTAAVLGFATKFAIRRGMNEALKMPDKNPWYRLDKLNEHDKNIFWLDEGFTVGSILFLGTIGAGLADGIIDGVSTIMNKVLGTDEKKARDLATMGTMVEFLPNAMGVLASIVHIRNHHYR